MRALSYISLICLSACVPLKTESSIATVDRQAGVVAEGASADQAPQSTTPTIATIRGCCTFTAPAGATVTTPRGLLNDGFNQHQVVLNGETVNVEPFLGAYGWLEAAGGTSIRVDGRPAREQSTVDASMVMVVPLRAQIDGRETLLSLRVRGDCSQPDCSLYRSIVGSLEIEAHWLPQSVS